MDKLCYCGTQHRNNDAFCDDCDSSIIKVKCVDNICCVYTEYDINPSLIESDTYFIQNI